MPKNAAQADSIRVCARFRPQNGIEKRHNGKSCIQISPDGGMCRVGRENNAKAVEFVFDRCFNIDSSQPKVFEFAVSHMIDQIMQGFNCTVFAYGQTGSGKTYSMEGQLGSPSRGIIPRLIEALFDAIQEADEVYEFVVKISSVEIYLEKLRDLLKPGNSGMRIRESKHGVYIQNVTEMYVREGIEVLNLMSLGARNRTVNATNMNAVSSRSHGVFSLKLISKDTNTGSTKMAKLMMVDLAGSEKIRKTNASGQSLEEAKKINQSLSCLGSVMNALSEGSSFVPYRDSVLTRILSDSLGGNCKTTLLICASCSSWNAEETISTLRFGTRAKKVKNKAKVNAEKTALEYKRELQAAKKEIVKLNEMVHYLKKDLANALDGTLTDAKEGMFAQLEAGEEMESEEEEEAPAKKSPKKRTFEGPGPKPAAAKTEVEGKGPGTVNSQFEEDEVDEQDSLSTEETSDLNQQVANGKVGMAEIAIQLSANQEQGRTRSSSQANLKKRASSKGMQEAIVLKSQEVQELLTLQEHLESKNTRLLTEVTKIRTELMLKSDQLFQQQQKAEEAEEAFGKSSMEQRVIMDENFSLKYERDRLVQERDDMKADLLSLTEEKDDYKKKATRLEQTYQDEVDNIRNEERSKIDSFIAQARQAIGTDGKSGKPKARGHFQAKKVFSSTDEELKQVKLDNVKLKQTLQEKVEDFVDMKLKAFQAEDWNKKLQEQVKRKDVRLRGQHNELAALGELKTEAGKFHHEIQQQLEVDIGKFKKDNKDLRRQVSILRDKQKHLKGTHVERDEAGFAVKKKLKTMVMPIRGGGKKKKTRKKKKTMTKQQMLGMTSPEMPVPQQQQMQESFNSYMHGKSPSMMNAGFYAAPPMNAGVIYQPAFGDANGLSQFENQIQIDSMPPTDELPEIPDFQNQQQMPTYFSNPYANVPHNRNSTFIEQTNFW